MKIYDLTLTLTADFPAWPGDPEIQLGRVSKLEDGENCNVSALSLSVHSGTHLDAPYHFIADGQTVDKLPLEVLMGAAQVVQIPDACKLITAEVLKEAGIAPETQRLLLRTQNSHYWANPPYRFKTQFTAISADGAAYLVERGIKLVGIDYLSVAPFRASRPTHVILLSAGIIPVEGLNLANVPAGFYQLYCLPLKLAGADGAPARVVLVDA
jgi:arylformamidase